MARDNVVRKEFALRHERCGRDRIAENLRGLFLSQPKGIFLYVAQAVFSDEDVHKLMEHRECTTVGL